MHLKFLNIFLKGEIMGLVGTEKFIGLHACDTEKV